MLNVRENRRSLSRRIELARVAVGTVFALLATAYWYIQIVKGEHYFTLSEENRIRSVKITAPRGYILDRYGAILVENEPAYTLHLYRREARDLASSVEMATRVTQLPRAEVNARLQRGLRDLASSVEMATRVTQLPRAEVNARLQRGLRDPEFLPIPVVENLRIEEVAAIQARAPEHPEFAIAVSQRRLYRHGRSAAHALGYLSEATPDQIRRMRQMYRLGDWIGQKGVESTYERLLAGTNGERRVIVDSHGREISEENRIEARPGQNLFVTIDLPLQQIAEEYFRERVGAAVALDPKTGDILAMVSSPSYDPNWFTRRVTSREWSGLLSNRDHPLQNRALQSAYPPGSVFKIFIAYGALARGLVDPEWRVFCPGHATFYGRTFRCHREEGHGWVHLRDAIKVSCDVYFYNLGRRLGIDRIAEIARDFGFGDPTGVDLAFDRSGLVPSEEWALTKRKARWYPSETISVSIGQGPILVTPLQIARGLSGLLQGGRLPTPHLFLAGQDPRTGRRLRYSPEWHMGTALAAEKLAIVKDGMWAVLNEPGGTAYLSRVPGVEAGGKTGTVQVIGRESQPRPGADVRKLEDHAWFAGFAPLDDPKIVVVVFVENGGHGSAAAAPLGKLLLAYGAGKPIATPPAPSPMQRASFSFDRPIGGGVFR